MNAELLTDLNIIEAAAIANTSEETVNPGDHVRFWDDDKQCWQIGVYMTLWFYLTNGRETSPNWNDNRVMAKIATFAGGVTYADVTTINKIASAVQTANF